MRIKIALSLIVAALFLGSAGFAFEQSKSPKTAWCMICLQTPPKKCCAQLAVK
jgi:hypothetical protein